MREILFRGKMIDNGEWVYGFYCHVPRGRLDRDEHMIQAVKKSGKMGMLHAVDPASVGQFTGLLDKNGKRIFEGDICRNTKTNEIASVHWHGSMAGFVWNQKRDGSEYLYDFGALFRVHDNYEIIGNIHDNTELLEED